MNPKKQRFIEETLEFWQPYYEEELVEQDAIEIINNMTSFINLLLRWKKRKELRNKNADQRNVDTTNSKGANHGQKVQN